VLTKFPDINPFAIRKALNDVLNTLGYEVSDLASIKVLVQVRDEFSRRDLKWTLFGIIPKTDYSRLSNRQIGWLEDHEVRGYQFLAAKGYSVSVLPTIPTAVANIDMLLGKEYWELKTLFGGKSSLQKRLYEAVTKWNRLQSIGELLNSAPRVVLDNRESRITDARALKLVHLNILKLGIEKILVIRKDGRIQLIEKKALQPDIIPSRVPNWIHSSIFQYK